MNINLFSQIGLVLLLDPRGRRMLAGPWPWLGVALTALVFSPVLLWNAEHGWASFVFQGGRAVARGFNPSGLLASVGGPPVSLVRWAS